MPDDEKMKASKMRGWIAGIIAGSLLLFCGVMADPAFNESGLGGAYARSLHAILWAAAFIPWVLFTGFVGKNIAEILELKKQKKNIK